MQRAEDTLPCNTRLHYKAFLSGTINASYEICGCSCQSTCKLQALISAINDQAFPGRQSLCHLVGAATA